MKKIKIEKDFQIPGTDVVLEKGDQVRIREKELSSKDRNALPDSDFVFPTDRKYPIPDLAHARNALARVAQYGSPEEKSKVRAAVKAKFPSIDSAKEFSIFRKKSQPLKKEMSVKLPLLTVRVAGGKLIGYSRIELLATAEDLRIDSSLRMSDSLPGWISKAMISQPGSSLADQVRFQGGISELLEKISQGNRAIMNVSSERNYENSFFNWI